MTYILSVPSKTFLLGEYAALKDGPTLIIATDPRFKLIAIYHPGQEVDSKQIHPDSPAGKLIKLNAQIFQSYEIQFVDPYKGLGGFGASSAQFVMVAALKNCLKNITQIDNFELLKDYEKCAWDGRGLAPSGADIIAQLHGGLCFFHKAKRQLKTFSWPFSDLEYSLIHTGNKLSTHEHLKNVVTVDASELNEIVMFGKTSIVQGNSQNFIAAINNYASALQSQGLVAKQTQEILKQLSAQPEILAAKGCGALGADVVLILFHKQNQDSVTSWVKKNFNLIKFGQELETGLEINNVAELLK